MKCLEEWLSASFLFKNLVLTELLIIMALCKKFGKYKDYSIKEGNFFDWGGTDHIYDGHSINKGFLSIYQGYSINKRFFFLKQSNFFSFFQNFP